MRDRCCFHGELVLRREEHFIGVVGVDKIDVVRLGDAGAGDDVEGQGDVGIAGDRML